MKTINELTICVIDGLYTLFKKVFLLFHTALLRCFIYSRVGILDSSLRNSLPFHLIYLLPTHLPTKKCNLKKIHTYFNIVQSICQRVEIYRLVKLLTSSSFHYFQEALYHHDYFKISIFFIHETGPGKSNKSSMPSISIPSSSSSTVTTLFD